MLLLLLSIGCNDFELLECTPYAEGRDYISVGFDLSLYPEGTYTMDMRMDDETAACQVELGLEVDQWSCTTDFEGDFEADFIREEAWVNFFEFLPNTVTANISDSSGIVSSDTLSPEYEEISDCAQRVKGYVIFD